MVSNQIPIQAYISGSGQFQSKLSARLQLWVKL